MISNLMQLRWTVLLTLIVLTFVSSLWSLSLTGDWEGAALNFGTEMAGAVITYILLELIIGERQKRETEKQERETRKAELITRLSSDEREVAVPAAEELRRLDWLADGSLQGADLSRANLNNADLSGADLSRVNLSQADLNGADLSGSSLSKTNLSVASLRGANLALANLRGANLTWADLSMSDMGKWAKDDPFMEEVLRTDLRGADLTMADLTGTDLREADLRNANLAGTNLTNARVTGEQLAQASSLQGATLPDGVELGEKYWRAEFESWYNRHSLRGHPGRAVGVLAAVLIIGTAVWYLARQWPRRITTTLARAAQRVSWSVLSDRLC